MASHTLYIVAASILAVLVIAALAYQLGFADPIIEKIAALYLQAEAKEEGEKLKGEGIKAGTSFLTDQVKGNDVASGLLGAIKKD